MASRLTILNMRLLLNSIAKHVNLLKLFTMYYCTSQHVSTQIYRYEESYAIVPFAPVVLAVVGGTSVILLSIYCLVTRDRAVKFPS